MEAIKEDMSVQLMTCLPQLLTRVCMCIYSGYSTFLIITGPLAQSVERRADNAKVESSRLSWTTFFFLLPFSFFPFLVFFFSLRCYFPPAFAAPFSHFSAFFSPHFKLSFTFFQLFLPLFQPFFFLFPVLFFFPLLLK